MTHTATTANAKTTGLFILSLKWNGKIHMEEIYISDNTVSPAKKSYSQELAYA